MCLRVIGVFLSVIVLSRTQALLGLDEGDTCKRTADTPWTCVTLKKCAHIDVRILRPSICSFKGREPIICCPPNKMSKAEMNCKRYTKTICHYEDKVVWESKPPIVNHVIGGKPVKAHSRKYMETVEEILLGKNNSETCIFRLRDEIRSRCLNHMPLCNKFNMFRKNEDSTKRPNTLDWTDFGDDAVAIEIPGGSETVANNRSGTFHEVSSTTASVLDNFMPANGSEKLETTTESPQLPNSTEPPAPNARQWVVGGQLSLPRIHRHMAAIGYGRANGISWNCGGSLVSELWVMSAAHCTSAPDLGEAKWARLGELDLASTTEDARPQDRRIVRRINHPQYRPPAAYHDISLYKLDSPIVFNQYVAPVCLHTKFDIEDKKASVVGWGSTEFAGSTSSKLMEVDVTLVDHAECRQTYGSEDQQAPNGIDKISMVCAGEKEGGKDACTGDSGGPLAVNQPGTCLKKQVGITSFGRDCGLPNTPGIYTRVSTYVPWIESIVWP